MNHKTNVLHFYKTSLPTSKGGVEVFIDTLCNATSKYDVKNTVLSLAKNPSIDPINMDGYTVYQVKQNLFIASTGFSISAFAILKKLAADADVIHYHFPNPFSDFLHLVCRIKKPIIVTYHSDIIKQKKLMKLYKPLMNRFLGAADHIVATSPNYFFSSEVLQKYANKTSIIPIGIDITRYPKLNRERLTYWRARLSQPFFLFIGAIRYYKGLHILLEAINGTNIQVAIAGISGVERELRLQADKNNLHNVNFLGLVSDEDKVALLHLCHGFVFPSHLRSEAFGISLLEAASFGRPLISCEIGTGTSYINIHNETGLVVTPASIYELHNAMKYLVDNAEKATEFGRNAQNRSKEFFTADKHAKTYVNLYRELRVKGSV